MRLPALPYQTPLAGRIRGFGAMLSPVPSRRPSARPVSYYALFKWWLLLSQHPGCLSTQTSLRTQHGSGTLAGGLDSFPLAAEHYRPTTDSRDSRCGIRSLVETSVREDLIFIQSLYPRNVVARG